MRGFLALFAGILLRAQFTTLQLQCQDIVNISEILQILARYCKYEKDIHSFTKQDICKQLRWLLT